MDPTLYLHINFMLFLFEILYQEKTEVLTAEDKFRVLKTVSGKDMGNAATKNYIWVGTKEMNVRF